MKVYRTLLAFALAVPLWGQTTLKIDKDEFIRHAQSWQLPEYPQKSLDERHTGIVSATVGVDEKGRVTSVNTLFAPDVHLAEAVKLVVSQWVFRPFMQGGKAVPAESTIFVQFRLHPIGPNVMIPGLTKEPTQTIVDPHRHPDQ